MQVHFEAASLQLTCDMWILTASNPAVVPVYNSTDMDRCLIQESEKHTWWRKSGDASILSSISTVKFVMLLGHSVLVHRSPESCMLLGEAFCAANHALLNVEFVTAS
jgi:hypothetical protein